MMLVISKAKTPKMQLCMGLDHEEYRCRCSLPECRCTVVSVQFLQTFERFRKLIANPLKINCGYRCTRHNLEVGGMPLSRHQTGEAVDVAELPGIGAEIVIKKAFEAGFRHAKHYPEKHFFHLDIGG